MASSHGEPWTSHPHSQSWYHDDSSSSAQYSWRQHQQQQSSHEYASYFSSQYDRQVQPNIDGYPYHGSHHQYMPYDHRTQHQHRDGERDRDRTMWSNEHVSYPYTYPHQYPYPHLPWSRAPLQDQYQYQYQYQYPHQHQHQPQHVGYHGHARHGYGYRYEYEYERSYSHRSHGRDRDHDTYPRSHSSPRSRSYDNNGPSHDDRDDDSRDRYPHDSHPQASAPTSRLGAAVITARPYSCDTLHPRDSYAYKAAGVLCYRHTSTGVDVLLGCEISRDFQLVILGGKRDPGEYDPIVTAVRELGEETAGLLSGNDTLTHTIQAQTQQNKSCIWYYFAKYVLFLYDMTSHPLCSNLADSFSALNIHHQVGVDGVTRDRAVIRQELLEAKFKDPGQVTCAILQLYWLPLSDVREALRSTNHQVRGQNGDPPLTLYQLVCELLALDCTEKLLDHIAHQHTSQHNTDTNVAPISMRTRPPRSRSLSPVFSAC